MGPLMTKTKRRTTMIRFIVIASLGVATLASCSKSSTSGLATTTSGLSSTSPSTTKPTSTSTQSSTGPPTPPCAFNQVAVTSGPGSGATGHISAVVIFRNSSTTACFLRGYPGVAGLDSSGQQVTQAVRTLNGFMGGVPNGSTTPTVVLATGQSASSTVEGTDVPTGSETSCRQFPALLVTPPNTRQSVSVKASLPGCSPIQVHPVVPGTSGAIPNSTR